MNVKLLKSIILGIVLSVCLIGCQPNNRPADLPALYPCTITIVQEGVPLSGASISLVRIDTDTSVPSNSSSESNWIPTGATNQSGTAVIYTNARYVGSPLGRFKVIVEKKQAGESKLGPPPPEDSPAYPAWEEKMLGEILPLYTLVEAKYTSVDETPLEIEIKKGKNNLKLDIGAAVKERVK